MKTEMAVRVGNLVFADWQALQLLGGWSDTFIFPVSFRAGLPPGDYAQALRRLTTQLIKLRRSASLWVPTDAPGTWFTEELRQRLRGLPLPVAVVSGETVPSLRAFSFFPWTDRQPSPPPPKASPLFQPDLPAHAVRCLQVLGRIHTGYTSEIASLTGVSQPTARGALQELAARELVVYSTKAKEKWNYPDWRIQRRGMGAALRSWGVPSGISFEAHQERKVTHTRPRFVARLWPAWVRHGWPQVELWGGWSEVNLGTSYPDALVWGRVEGYETLIWLEVERGNDVRPSTLDDLRQKLISRFNRALVYVRRFSTGLGTRLRLVFAVLGPERVQQVARSVFHTLPGDAAVVIVDWRAFGYLPALVWGHTR